MSFALKDNLVRVEENVQRFLEEFRHNGYSHTFREVSYRGIAAEIFFNGQIPVGLSNNDIWKCYDMLFSAMSYLGLEEESRNLFRCIPVATLKVNVPLESPHSSSTIRVKFIPDTRSTFLELNSEALQSMNEGTDFSLLKSIHTTPFEELASKASEAKLRNRIDSHFMNHKRMYWIIS